MAPLTLVQINSLLRSCLLCYGMYSSISGLCTPDTRSTPHPITTIKNVFRYRQTSPVDTFALSGEALPNSHIHQTLAGLTEFKDNAQRKITHREFCIKDEEQNKQKGGGGARENKSNIKSRRKVQVTRWLISSERLG